QGKEIDNDNNNQHDAKLRICQDRRDKPRQRTNQGSDSKASHACFFMRPLALKPYQQADARRCGNFRCQQQECVHRLITLPLFSMLSCFTYYRLFHKDRSKTPFSMRNREPIITEVSSCLTS